MSKPQLIISQPGQRTRRVAIEKNLVSIGRKTDNTIALEGDTSVSKYHAVIELRADGFWLSDLDSRNGTTVNEQPVKTEHKLTSGDLICVGGKSTVEFLLPATGADAPPPDAPAAQPAAASSPQPQPTPAPPAPSPEAKPGGGSLMIVACVVGGLVLVGALVALLFATGVLGGSSNKNSADNDARGPSARRRDDD
ncbi:MAG TPA: FHA domain-containing protein, partial [Pyrinomonadaceae bacterium]|nr:FHA domain-containing protein [Pyrinomonadaceae bacterium]